MDSGGNDRLSDPESWIAITQSHDGEQNFAHNSCIYYWNNSSRVHDLSEPGATRITSSDHERLCNSQLPPAVGAACLSARVRSSAGVALYYFGGAFDSTKTSEGVVGTSPLLLVERALNMCNALLVMRTAYLAIDSHVDGWKLGFGDTGRVNDEHRRKHIVLGDNNQSLWKCVLG